MKELTKHQEKLMRETLAFAEHMKSCTQGFGMPQNTAMGLALLAQTAGTLNDMVRMIERRLDQIEAREQTEDMENSEKEGAQ